MKVILSHYYSRDLEHNRSFISDVSTLSEINSKMVEISLKFPPVWRLVDTSISIGHPIPFEHIIFGSCNFKLGKLVRIFKDIRRCVSSDTWWKLIVRIIGKGFSCMVGVRWSLLHSEDCCKYEQMVKQVTILWCLSCLEI